MTEIARKHKNHQVQQYTKHALSCHTIRQVLSTSPRIMQLPEIWIHPLPMTSHNGILNKQKSDRMVQRLHSTQDCCNSNQIQPGETVPGKRGNFLSKVQR
jgi:hypothetical protein